jgi:L-arabinose isomerase
LPVARAVWRPEPNLGTASEGWLIAGGPHHTALSSALGAEHLTDLADLVGVELVLIDSDTTIRALRKEIRWNQAYYRLAQGF